MDSPSSFTSLQNRIALLPRELSDLVLDSLLETNLCVGKVFPTLSRNNYKPRVAFTRQLKNPFPSSFLSPDYPLPDSSYYQLPSFSALLAVSINRRLYSQALALFFSRNTFVIPRGPACQLTLFDAFPPRATALIRSVDIGFSWRDVDRAFSPGDPITYIAQRQTSIVDNWTDDGTPESPSSTVFLEDRWLAECDDWVSMALNLWDEKFSALMKRCGHWGWGMEYIGLDFDRAVGLNGEYLVPELAKAIGSSLAWMDHAGGVVPSLAWSAGDVEEENAETESDVEAEAGAEEDVDALASATNNSSLKKLRLRMSSPSGYLNEETMRDTYDTMLGVMLEGRRIRTEAERIFGVS